VCLKKGQRNWKSKEAMELIRVFESHHFLFGVMSSDEDVWILIASALQERGMEVNECVLLLNFIIFDGNDIYNLIIKTNFKN
jgi:hypothetical protein